MREPVYVAGWPKSGCTWLTRLLGDALNCPTGGAVPSEDEKEIATEGRNRPEPYMVRKAHLSLLDRRHGPAIPAPHVLAWRQITNERFVYIVRDPRDVAVSSAFYFGRPLEEVLDRMGRGWPPRGKWQDYVERWLDVEFGCVHTSFEALLINGVREVRRILMEADLPIAATRIAGAVDRQAFANRPPDTHLRKGIAGDWRNHFDRNLRRKAHRYFGSLMKRLGYIGSDDWWKRI